MKTLKIILALVVIWNLTDFFVLRNKHTCYVDVSKVYAGFDMKKDYEKMVKDKQSSQKNTIDSLELDLRQMSMKIEAMDSVKQKHQYEAEIRSFLLKRKKYIEIKNSLEYNYKKSIEEFDEKIWTQINAAVSEYGKEYGYNYIFGAMGNGSMMYACEGDNRTNDFIHYLNKKYKDG